GAARAVAFALRDAARIAIMNRTRERAEKLVDDFRALKLPLVVGAWNEIENSNLIVNATSVGMFPLVEDSPLPREIAIPRDAVVFDLVYRPARTRLIAQSERAGARTIGGLEMLVYQGARAFELWTNKNAPLDVMMRAAIV
ncbi:MAG: shikimate dehydrogenase, partial [Chloroflexi bacterium]|nr:shikimate dehydrogenase [Chloroflexota bacterium]